MSDTSRSSGRWLFTTLFAVVLMLAVFGTLTVLRRQADMRALGMETEANAMPTVGVIHPTVEGAQDDLVLPGTLQPFAEAPVYARASGYLRRWTHDIGSRVKTGELLAEIDAPEQDQELAQAKASREQIAANL